MLARDQKRDISCEIDFSYILKAVLPKFSLGADSMNMDGIWRLRDCRHISSTIHITYR
jgi:hypothetical protein